LNEVKIQNVNVCVGRYQCIGQIHAAGRAVPSSATLLTCNVRIN